MVPADTGFLFAIVWGSHGGADFGALMVPLDSRHSGQRWKDKALGIGCLTRSIDPWF